MMSKKMKRAALGTSPAYGGVYEDAKTRLKHQNLLQDYQDLLKDADDMRNKLDFAQQRKLILLAEVRFLRRRHKYLLKMKSLNSPQEQHMNVENQRKLGTKERVLHRRETAQFKLPPLPDLKHKGRVYAGKEGALKSMTPSLDLNCKVTSRPGKEVVCGLSRGSDSKYRKRITSVKEVAIPNIETAISFNQNEKLRSGNRNTLGMRMPVFDLNQDNTCFSGKEAALPTRAPIFDLNEISKEEEELQSNYEMTKFEEPQNTMIRAGNEEQPTDMKLSICRNAGEGSSRMGKRKISWQDPVALRV